VDRLTFRTTARQLLGLGLYVLLLAGVAVALAVTMVVTHASWGSRISVWVIAAVIVAVVALWALVMSAVAFTECTPAGIRTRGLARTHSCSWAEVGVIVSAPRQSWRYGRTPATVSVITTSGSRFRLGAPVAGGVMRDPEFAAKFAQIQEYWQANRADQHA
jgi:hypothetical protein